MDHHKFMEYLRHVPNHPSYKVVPHVYKNAKGVDEVIWLHQCYWDDVDWLETQGDIGNSDRRNSPSINENIKT